MVQVRRVFSLSEFWVEVQLAFTSEQLVETGNSIFSPITQGFPYFPCYGDRFLPKNMLRVHILYLPLSSVSRKQTIFLEVPDSRQRTPFWPPQTKDSVSCIRRSLCLLKVTLLGILRCAVRREEGGPPSSFFIHLASRSMCVAALLIDCPRKCN